MRGEMWKMAAAAGLALGMMHAQNIDLGQFEGLRQKASKTVDVNLTEPMLKMAAGFIGKADNDPEAAQVKNLIGGLKGVFVRSFKFDSPGQYSAADVETIRKKLTGAGWQSLVDVHSNKPGDDNAGVYVRTNGKQMMGMVVLAMQPLELTIVDITGAIDPAQVQALSGTLGIPNFNVGFDNKSKAAGSGKAKE
jgi:hypothetical protein